MPKIRTDFHNHIVNERELKGADLPLFVETAYRRLGRGGIVGVVDYYGETKEQKFAIFCDRLKGYDKKRIAGNTLWVPAFDLYFTRVIESEAKQGDILTIGLDEGVDVPSSRDLHLEDALTQIGNQGGIRDLDHFFGFLGTGPYVEQNEYILVNGLVEALEIKNRLAIPPLAWRHGVLSPNRKGEAYFQDIHSRHAELKVGATFGTDGYYERAVGKYWSSLNLPIPIRELRNSEEIQESLRKSISSNVKYEGHAGPTSYYGVLQHGLGMMFKLGGPVQTIKQLFTGK